VRENCAALEKLGKNVGIIGVEKDARVTWATLEKALAKHPDARLAAIMAVNNEIGSVTDIASLSPMLKSRDGPPVHLHVDMVQAIGKVPVDLSLIDSASMSSHKIGGPRGIGLLFLKRRLEPLCTGGGQESGVRPGTENVAGALALAAALERRLGTPAADSAEGGASVHPASACRSVAATDYAAVEERFARLIAFLRSQERCRLIPADRGERDPRFSPYIVQAAFKGIPGEVLVRVMDDNGFSISTGSACSSASLDRPVLAAMGVDKDTQREGIRISQGWSTTEDDITALIEALQRVIMTL
jgi:cysteine desulfurase